MDCEIKVRKSIFGNEFISNLNKNEITKNPKFYGIHYVFYRSIIIVIDVA